MSVASAVSVFGAAAVTIECGSVGCRHAITNVDVLVFHLFKQQAIEGKLTLALTSSQVSYDPSFYCRSMMLFVWKK